MKIFASIVAGLFFLSAVVQINDPDPIYWIAVYTGTALVVLGKTFDRSNRFWAAVLIGAISAGMLMAAPGFGTYVLSGEFGSIFGDMRVSSYVEETREFLGLTIALIAVVYCLKR